MSNEHQELWTIRGNEPVIWQIPCYVMRENRAELSVFEAVPLLKIHKAAFDAHMEQFARKETGLWLIAKSELNRIGTPMEAGTDPETCFAWERPRKAKRPEFRPNLRKNRDDFLDALYLDGVGESRDEVEHWWYVFCQHALNWLVNRERPVDMYFADLVPLPFVNHWLHLMERRRFNMWRRRKTLTKRENLEKYLTEPHLLAGDKGNVIRRKLELELKPLWWETIKRVETERRHRLGSDEYAAAVKASIKRAIPAAVRIVRTYVAQKNSLVVGFEPGRVSSNSRIRTFPKPEKRPEPDWGTSPQYRTAVLKWQAFHRRRAERLSRQNAGLSAV